MKKQFLSFCAIITFSFYLSSCSKDESTSGSGSVSSGPFPTTNSPNSPNAAANTQPSGCGTFYPMFKGSNYTFTYNGSSTDTIYGNFSGTDTTINAKKYTILNSTQSSTGTSKGFMRRDGSKVYSYNYASPTPFEMIILDESKKVGDQWNGGQFTISASGIESINTYTFKMVKQHPSYTLSNGLKFNDVIEVSMSVKGETKMNGSVVATTNMDGGTQLYAKCVGIIRTFTPKNPTIGLNSDIIQEVKRYKM